MPLFALVRDADDTILALHIPEDKKAEGLDPGLSYLEQVDSATPNVDLRCFSIQSTRVVDRLSTPAVVRLTHTAVPRPLAERITHVENREATELHRHCQPNEIAKLALLGVFILLRKSNNLQLTPDEEAVASRLEEVGSALLLNHQCAQEKIDLLQQNQVPDFDAGWKNPSQQ